MIRKISDALSIASQPASHEFEGIAKAGFCAVLNLQSPLEPNTRPNEKEMSEAWGLNYQHFPFQLSDIENLSQLERILDSIQRLPKPLLIYCDDSVRSSAIALLKVAVDQGFSLKQAQEKLFQLNLRNEGRASPSVQPSSVRRKAIRFKSMFPEEEKLCFPRSSMPTPLSTSSQSLHCS